MNKLAKSQVDSFWQNGYLMLEDALSSQSLHALNGQLTHWIDESRTQTQAYGQTFDHRPRFDVQPGHNATRPALRRIASPVEISDAYLHAMRDNAALDALTDIIGPNIKFENAKINCKQPGTATEVKFHQDFMFEAHTNDDMVTVLFFLDEVTMENGPLEVVPGSHRGTLHDHWHGGVFTGAVSDEVANGIKADAIPCCGPAGSACLMHTRLLHGSAPNLSNMPRSLFICAYTAEDSYPLHGNHIPSRFMYEVVRGQATGRIRCSEYEMILPEMPTGASFFEQQAKAT